MATWPGSVIVDEYVDNDRDDYKEYERIDYSDCHFQHRRIKSMPANLEQNQNRAVLFAGAVPYAAVRAAYECKVIVINNYKLNYSFAGFYKDSLQRLS